MVSGYHLFYWWSNLRVQLLEGALLSLFMGFGLQLERAASDKFVTAQSVRLLALQIICLMTNRYR